MRNNASGEARPRNADEMGGESIRSVTGAEVSKSPVKNSKGQKPANEEIRDIVKTFDDKEI